MERECAWTGARSAGKHYLLSTTEGVELVSADALRGAAAERRIDRLEERLADLEERLADLGARLAERDADPGPEQGGVDAGKAPAKKAAPRPGGRG